MLAIKRADAEILMKGLEALICITETGTPVLRARDIQNGCDTYEGRKVALKALDAHEAQLVKRSEALIKDLRRREATDPERTGVLSLSEYEELCALQSNYRASSLCDRTVLMPAEKHARMIELKSRLDAYGKAPSTRDLL